ARLLSEPYLPTAGTRSGNRIGRCRAAFRLSRQWYPVWKRQYHHRVGITQTAVGRHPASQYSEELWNSDFADARQAQLRRIPCSERHVLGRIATSDLINIGTLARPFHLIHFKPARRVAVIESWTSD